MLTIRQLNDLFTKENFRPLKRLGANYLIDANIKDKIIEYADISKDDTVVEIGSGLGALTFDLAGSAKEVIAVEIDRRGSAILKKLAGSDYPNLKIYNQDILKFDLKSVVGERKVKVVSNLPYYITTPIIEYLIDNKVIIDQALIMVQKEVADRLLAEPGTKNYSSISCFIAYFTKLRYVYTVKRTSFYPSPDVDSCILKMTMLQKPPVEVADRDKLFMLIRGAFNQRRKSIINSLSREPVLNMPKDALSCILKMAGIDPTARPETLSLADFAAIANAVFR